MPPAAATGAAATGAAASSAGASSSAASSSAASYLSTMSGVIGVRESTVLVNFDPFRTWQSLRAPSVFRSPESMRSGKIAGSSKFAGSRTVPSSALQHSTAGSFACCLAVSAVIDISIFLLKMFCLAFANIYLSTPPHRQSGSAGTAKENKYLLLYITRAMQHSHCPNYSEISCSLRYLQR